MAIAKGSIRDRGSFDELSTAPHEISALYFYLSLDCLVDLAHAISCDFFARPQLYTAVADERYPELIADLARLHARCGSDERFPSHEQREAVYRPLFGSPDAMANGSDFVRLRNELIEASAAFATRVFNEGVEMLRERVRTTHRPFKEYLRGLRGDSLTWSREVTLSGISDDVAYSLLRSPGIAAVFGIATPAPETWPYAADSNGDKTVEQMSVFFTSANSDTTMAGMVPITREGISYRQRTALRGAEALAAIVDYQEDMTDKDLDVLITRCYTWGSALHGQGPVAGAEVPRQETFSADDRPSLSENLSVSTLSMR